MGIIRVLLAIAVLIVHSSPIFGLKLMSGDIAVQAFYIISGFYMSLILNEKYIGLNNSCWLFLSNRFIRLYPTYFILTIIAILISLMYGYLFNNFGVLQPIITGIDGKNLSLSTIITIIIVNVTLLGQDIISFFTIDEHSGNLIFSLSHYDEHYPFLPGFVKLAWTVSVEFMFYVFSPILLRNGYPRIIFGFVCSIFIRFVLYEMGIGNYPWLYRFFPTEIIFFLLGGISYQLYKKISTKTIPLSVYWSVFILLITYTLLSGKLISNSTWDISLQSRFVYYIALTLSIPFIFILTKNLSWDKFLGNLSYPIYLSHVVVLLIVQTNRFPKIESLGTTLIITTIPASIIIFFLIEKPIEHIRQKRLTITSRI